MTEQAILTAVDINSGIGGRSQVFRELGIQVLAAVESDGNYRRIFSRINPELPHLDIEPVAGNLERIPRADILTADISPAKLNPHGKYAPDDLFHFLSELLLRDAPRAFVFQASVSALQKAGSAFLESAAMRRYQIFYQLFREADYVGIPMSGKQLYIVGIRCDIPRNGFAFPKPSGRAAALADFLEKPDEIDPWYRCVSGVSGDQFAAGAVYVRGVNGKITRTDRLSLSAFSESCYCDALGLRRLTHNEYAALKGYPAYPFDFNGHTNRRAMYRMLFHGANLFLFRGIADHLKRALDGSAGEPPPEDLWPHLEPSGVEGKEAKLTKKPAGGKVVQPRNRLLRLHVDRLKGLHHLDISFSKSLTAIMGVNCSGKSTVLHALACVFQPVEAGENHQFNFFFTPNPDARWNDSKLSITCLDENTQEEITRGYQKKSDRWSPKYSSRPKREVFFVGIDTCSPEIEKERQTSYISYSTDTLEGRQSEQIKKTLSYVMDKPYAEITSNKTRRKFMIGVRTSDDIGYSALSMGAGEQRVFKILKLVHDAPAFSLILIDEIDLLLHVKALRRLIETLAQIAERKKIQIIFTTHSLAMRDLTDYVEIRYLYQTPNKTMVFDTITPDIVYALANETERALTVYVEDDLAAAIVQRVVSALGLSRHTAVKMIGSSENAFTLAAGLVLQEDTQLQNKLIVLDGDVYRSREEKEKQIVRKLSGTEAGHDEKVETALSLLTQLCLPEGVAPEKYIHSLMTENEGAGGSDSEILHCARQIAVVRDPHDWVDKIVEQMNQDRAVTLFQIVSSASTHREWAHYVENVSGWLTKKKAEMKLRCPDGEESLALV